MRPLSVTGILSPCWKRRRTAAVSAIRKDGRRWGLQAHVRSSPAGITGGDRLGHWPGGSSPASLLRLRVARDNACYVVPAPMAGALLTSSVRVGEQGLEFLF